MTTLPFEWNPDLNYLIVRVWMIWMNNVLESFVFHWLGWMTMCKWLKWNVNSNEMWICDQEWQFDTNLLMGQTRPNLCVWNFELPVNFAVGIKCMRLPCWHRRSHRVWIGNSISNSILSVSLAVGIKCMRVPCWQRRSRRVWIGNFGITLKSALALDGARDNKINIHDLSWFE